MSSWLARWLGRGAPSRPAAAAAPAEPPASAADLLAAGNRLLAAGQAAQAGELYAKALKAEPASTAAAVNFAFASLQIGRAADARGALLQALASDPTQADALFMLGQMALESGDAPGAVDHLSKLLDAHPAFPHAYPLLGRAHVANGQRERALQILQAGLARWPASPDLLHDLGNVQLLSDRTEEAAASYRQALTQDPNRPDSRASLGHCLLHLGRRQEARAELLRALDEGPLSAESCHTLGNALQALGLLDQAGKAYELAIQRHPAYAPAHQSLGALRQARGRGQEARAAFARVTELQPDSPRAWTELGMAQQDLRQFDEAQASYLRALRCDADFAPAHAQLGVLAVEQGDTAQALSRFEKALALDPDNLEVRSNQLWALCYGAEPARYALAAREFGDRLARLARPFTEWKVEPGPTPSPLRVGLVSGDLRAHPVGYFIESVLQSLADHGVVLHAFPTSAHEDAVTTRLRQRCAGWAPLVGMYDQVAAECIREQGIHVLVDLAGHTAYNRLRVFGWRPAPVQVSWLGFFASTGVRTIDYLLADEACVPHDATEAFTETVWRLPDTRLCFTAPADEADFPPTPLPALRNGFVTLGSYQNLSKVNDEVLHAWRRVLASLPDARLRLQSKQTGPATQAPLLRRLAAAGLPVERIVLAPPAPRAAYLKSYADVDLLLDTFPFPGGTTTCEALWMGVPTVTLAGRTMMSNQGKALLSAAGLGDWIAGNVEQYVEMAIARASDLDALAALRAGLRQQVLASPLFDGPRFARALAQALFAMWRRHAAVAPTVR